MTILNLNGPAGREPRSKKTVRAWMGVGLVIAVLGLGSTFAANIQINNASTEFGQGVTRTVYCGAGEDQITITPVSSFVNGRTSSTQAIAAIPARWIAPTFTGRSFVKVSSSSSVGEGTYVNDSSGVSETKVKGYWVSSRTSSNPTVSSNGSSSGSNTVFAPQVKDDGDNGFYRYSSWTPGSMSVAVAGVPSVTSRSNSKFELKSITVSDIDGDCDGRDFLLSAYDDEDDSPLSLINSKKIIAVLYDEVNDSREAVFSFSRSGRTQNPTRFATVENKPNGKFTITFVSDGNDRLDTDDLANIVIETQDDVLGNWSPGNYVDDEDDEDDDD